MTPTPLPRGQALHTARRLGLVHSPTHTPAIAPDWRPLWWALTEFGELTPTLLARLDHPHCPPTTRLIRRLTDTGWLDNDRSPGRPAGLIALTRHGRDTYTRQPYAPLWTASSRDVARRALANILTQAPLPASTPALIDEVIAHAAHWNRRVCPADVRAVLLAEQRAGLLRTTHPRPRWHLTDTGRRALRAIADATGERPPRHGRTQDTAHDGMLESVAVRLATLCPAIVGTLRVARRIHLPPDDSGRARWIIPDGLAGLHTTRGPILLAIEVERRGRYPDLARHIANYRRLAGQRPWCRMCVLVVSGRVTDGRRRALTNALHTHRHDSHDEVIAGFCTPAGASRQAHTWGIDATTHAFDPSPTDS